MRPAEPANDRMQPSKVHDPNTLKNINDQLDRAITQVRRAKALLDRLRCMDEHPDRFLDMLGLVERDLLQAKHLVRPVENWLEAHGDGVVLGADDPHVADLTTRLENQFRESMDACEYVLTLLSPAPINLTRLNELLANAQAETALEKSLEVRKDQELSRDLRGIQAEMPGSTPRIDEIDPKHYFRRQLDIVHDTLVQGSEGRMQFHDPSCRLGAVFLKLDPTGRNLVQISFSRDNQQWHPLFEAPVPQEEIDPIVLLEPFAATCDQPVVDDRVTRILTPAQLAVTATHGSG